MKTWCTILCGAQFLDFVRDLFPDHFYLIKEERERGRERPEKPWSHTKKREDPERC